MIPKKRGGGEYDFRSNRYIGFWKSLRNKTTQNARKLVEIVILFLKITGT